MEATEVAALRESVEVGHVRPNGAAPVALPTCSQSLQQHALCTVLTNTGLGQLAVHASHIPTACAYHFYITQLARWWASRAETGLLL